MDIRKLQKLAVTALEDVKAKEIEVLNTSKLSALFDRIIAADIEQRHQANQRRQSSKIMGEPIDGFTDTFQ